MSGHGQDGAPELSRPFHVESLSQLPEQDSEITAGAEECAALAARFDLPAVNALSARLRVRRRANGDIAVSGHVTAEVVQVCVVTLEPFVQPVEGDFAQDYTERPAVLEPDMTLGPEDEEPPEPVVGGIIDLGELVAQNLALSLDPFPRAPGAVLATAEETSPAVDGQGGDGNPFAVLARIKPDAGK